MHIMVSNLFISNMYVGKQIKCPQVVWNSLGLRPPACQGQVSDVPARAFKGYHFNHTRGKQEPPQMKKSCFHRKQLSRCNQSSAARGTMCPGGGRTHVDTGDLDWGGGAVSETNGEESNCC